MTPIPDVQPLSRTHRKIVFILAIVLFSCTVPVLVFHAMGYRFDFSSSDTNFKKVGGMYVSSDIDDVGIYVDDQLVEDMRVFQNAAYIQNLESGMYQIHTQKEGLQTWVKELPVFAHYVTEAQGFNMPSVPQLRLVTEFMTGDNASVIFENATTTHFANASTTNTFFVATSTATTSYTYNQEYAFLEQLFASSTEKRLLTESQNEITEKSFLFSADLPATTSLAEPVATTTKHWNDVSLYELNDEVYARWTGKPDDVPHYFCVSGIGATSTELYYGSHVYEAFEDEYSASSTDTLSDVLVVADRFCRTQIRIDRLWQDVQWFDFFPGSRDHVLMQLQDGLYVVEVDDRAWQNTQMLYSGDYLEVLLDGGRIFVKDHGYIFEVFTELQTT